MTAVRLNRRVTLERPARTSDGAGGFDTVWQELGTLWAALEPRGGRLVNGATGETSVARYRFTLRAAPPGHSDRPVPGQRMRMSGRLFRIEAVSERDAQARYLVCDCEEEMTP